MIFDRRSRFRGGDGMGVTMQADYVIVGAGSAGCVLANRLTEDPATRVVLIEAGGRDWNPLIHIPAGFMKLLDHPTLTWGFKAEADPGTAGRAIVYPRGRVLGGSSSINGLIYIRGQPEDFDHWAQLGNRGWGWEDVLPYFKRAEDWQGEASELHGDGGFLTTSPMSERPPACQLIIEAAQEIGLEYRPDVNNLPPGAGDSIGWCQQTRGGRRRASTARTYLRPASRRQNLQVVTKGLVHRVMFDGRRAVGVEFSRNGRTERIDAEREVILAAGAVGSPHLLQLSGVGDPEVLAKAGIPVHHALPGVGKNFQDHYIARMSCEVHGIETLNERGRGLSFAGELVRYVTEGKGMLTYSASLCAASVKVLEESATPDVQCVFAPASYKPGLIRKLDDKPGITGGPWQMRPLSRGYVLVRSSDPREQPAINPRYLAEDTDRRAMIGGLKFLRRLFAAPALAKYVIAERMPGPSVETDDELLDYARQNGSTVYHASCSCMMGNHAMSVVDSELKVHGLDGLRVIDASIMPAVSSTNTNAPTIMIAEKGAAMILEAARQKLAA
jgi:choline dehydrogenase